MDKAARLIKWQRITILLLIFVSVVTSFMAHEARRQEDFWWNEVGYSDAEIGDLERRHTEDQRIIHDQNDRLQSYQRGFDPACPTPSGASTLTSTSAQ